MNIISLSDARANLPSLVKKINDGFDRFIVTVNNKPGAVLISAEELESLEETAEVSTIPGFYESLKKSTQEMKSGKGITLTNLQKKYDLN